MKNYRGAIQTDGYGVYDYFELQDGVTILGCMAHVRRKFTDAQMSHPTRSAKPSTMPTSYGLVCVGTRSTDGIG